MHECTTTNTEVSMRSKRTVGPAIFGDGVQMARLTELHMHTRTRKHTNNVGVSETPQLAT